MTPLETTSLKTLSENAGLAFPGEIAWPASVITNEQADAFIIAANSCGRPNSDILHRRIAVVDGAPVESWQIDFPDHFRLQEATLYEEPFDHLQRNAPDWKNPHLNPALRRALARVSRYLAMPVSSAAPDWIWIEDELIPDASLVIVARDDDFTHGILSSDTFDAWHRSHFGTMPAEQIVESFPFPWPPGIGLSALTAAQEEARHAVARAARGDHRGVLHEAVCRAYGWPIDWDEAEILARLQTLHRQRAVSS